MTRTGPVLGAGGILGSASTVGEAVPASCSIPGWFTPQVIGGRRYVDGGVASSTSPGLLARPGAPELDEVDVLAPMASHARPPSSRTSAVAPALPETGTTAA
ncbi:patatin-like phospholipase family protein [Pseudonocardia sp. KRD-184]|uniref:Patatin-like phospholipase family protein n=1 Tax=Pseudonocardia oceani TaxID=2792013 RepID=A0ABS6U3R8_9PSEU|nr:patatin-like phospholipase family protein [Pseudonocardia oceani]MBW0093025.1 patatin-like phospholipase family protein [Pseudonocardia oceani]MBW0098095.1 patatin-like phospholipase family protein [Pseudonocardia oceani]MBW0112497.1 patatin-like phospholipase family protein [Pseudonocardia oceani]MBW0124700.1 patatin-like phospholipase family protein [Pseudonocardia oceani]MBW0126877.1 patatin-like phospholipase family protein [Pseudonocardia oceani]